MSSEKVKGSKDFVTPISTGALRSGKSRVTSGSTSSLNNEEFPNRKRAASSPAKVLSFKDPLPLSLNDLEILCENVHKYKRSLKPEMTSAGLVTSGYAIAECFQQVVEAYRSLAARIDAFDEVYDAIRGLDVSSELQAMKNDIRNDLADLVRSEVAVVVAEKLQAHDRDRMDVVDEQFLWIARSETIVEQHD
ncbi:uncharacterized protein LOC103572825 [Microplitis demolitor]|uniref:uncharacterized protein LOC103572825 n=1 Tax=Microplitis demolitor TaxID=69319 RepID=UPI0006D5035F|nr:uncharacterized protein LOC103572825 [Microplitis demolitor]